MKVDTGVLLSNYRYPPPIGDTLGCDVWEIDIRYKRNGYATK